MTIHDTRKMCLVYISIAQCAQRVHMPPSCRISTDPSGHKYAKRVQCARVYHINIVLRIRTSTQDKVRNRAYREKSMQIQRYTCSIKGRTPLVNQHTTYACEVTLQYPTAATTYIATEVSGCHCQ